MSQRRSTNSNSKIPDEFFDLKPGDIIIAVMGVTGVGKSTFINFFSERPVLVGRSLVSCTNQVEIYKCTDHILGKFYLIDTPGFDDTYRTDTDILMEVAAWLSHAYKRDILLTGIVYLHRIFDNRLGGSAMKNLRSFRRLCGNNAMSKVVLATTFWGQVDEQTGIEHEGELKTKADFWGSMIANGSKIFRQDSDRRSARQILQHLVNKKTANDPAMTLDIQREIVDQHKNLDQTGAGKEMNAELAAQKAEYEREIKELQAQLFQAMRENDERWQEDLKQLEKVAKDKADQAEADKKKLAADNKELMKNLERLQSTESQQRSEESANQRKLLAGLEYELKMMESRNAALEEKYELRQQLQEQRNKLEMLRWKIRQSQARCSVM